MDDLLSLSVFLGVIVGLIKAISPIVTTTITQKQKTERARLSSGVTSTSIASEKKENPAISSIALLRKGKRSDAFFGIFAVALSTLQLGLLQFSSLKSSPLTVGATASIAECMLLCGIGWFLLVRR